jgi:hypothetical protein
MAVRSSLSHYLDNLPSRTPLTPVVARGLVPIVLVLLLIRSLFVVETIVPTHSKALVVASSSESASSPNAAWLSHVPLDWFIYHYNTDLTGDDYASAEALGQHPHFQRRVPPSGGVSGGALPVPVNKGNEAMVYLTYIIDHYHALPDVVFFHHDHARSWHQPLDAAVEITRLRTEYVLERGYVSPRCLTGCENIIALGDVLDSDLVPANQLHLAMQRDVQLRSFLAHFLDADEPIPDDIAAPCCGQFAASRTAIRRRSLRWWREMRQWLIDTELTNYFSGRLLEYTWHIWLGEEARL